MMPRWFGWSGLLLVVTSTGCAGGPQVQPAPTVTFRLRDFHLPSGLRVVVEEDHSAPVVGVVNVVGVGSTADPPGKEGLAHLVEHLTFRASPAAGRSFGSLLDQAGAANRNAETNFDATTYWEFGQKDSLLDLLTLEGLRIVDPLVHLDEATFATERAVVENELRYRAETNVAGSVWAKIQQTIFPADHPYARPATHQTLAGLTLADARAFTALHYRPANMTVLVIGDVRLETFEKLMQASLSPALNHPSGDPVVHGPRLPALVPEPPAPPASAGPMVEMQAPVPTPEIYLAWSMPRTYDRNSHLMAMGQFSLGNAAQGAYWDNDVVGTETAVVPGAQASVLLCRVILRTGSHPEKSAARVTNKLFEYWMASDGEGAAAAAAQLFFNQERAQILSQTLLSAEDITRRGLERATFIHFSDDASLFTRKVSALEGLDRGNVVDFHYRYLNRDRARMILVRPLTGQAPTTGPPPTAHGPATAADQTVTYDVASIARVAAPLELGRRFTTARLDDGLTVASARHGHTPMVTIGLTFAGGTADEATPGASSLALLAALVQRNVQGRLQDHGAFITHSSNEDSFGFRVYTPSPHLGPVLKILAEHAQRYRVHDARLATFDRDFLPYIQKEQQIPENRARRAFQHALFAGQLYQHTNEMPDQHRPTADEANAWLEATLAPARGTLTIVGNVDPTQAQALAKEAFGDWTGGAPPPAPPAPLSPAGRPATIVVNRAGATQAQVRIGCRLPPVASASAAVAYDVLAETVQSRLWKDVRNNLGTSYGFTATARIFREGSAVLIISGAVENKGLSSALGLIHAQLAEPAWLAGHGLDGGRWAVAREYNLALDTPEDWVSAVLDASHHGWPLASIDQVPGTLRAIDPQPLMAALKRCASEGVVSIVGDEAAARRDLAAAWR